MTRNDGKQVDHLLQRMIVKDDGRRASEEILLTIEPIEKEIAKRLAAGMQADDLSRTAGRMWAAVELAKVTDRTTKIIGPPVRRRGLPLTPAQLVVGYVISAARSWPAADVDALDADLYREALTLTDLHAVATRIRMRGALEMTIAWLDFAQVSDRHMVPVSLRSKIEALLQRADADGVACGSGSGAAADRQRAADMAAGRAQAFRQVLGLLGPIGVDVDADSEDLFVWGTVERRDDEIASGRPFMTPEQAAHAYSRVRVGESPLAGALIERFNLQLAELHVPGANPWRSVLISGEGDGEANGLGEPCEGCPEPATTRDVMGVPLCAACYDALEPIDSPQGEP